MPIQMQLPDNRHAAFLNNVGCALLERCAFEDALSTFSDALFLAKQDRVCATTDPSSEKPFANPSDCSCLQEKIQSANQRIASPNVCSCNSCSSTSKALPVHDTETKAPPFPPVLKLEDYCQFDVEDILLQASATFPMIFPVRIEEQYLAIYSQDLFAGILVFNLGLSYACLAECNSHDCKIKQNFQVRATRMFQLADIALQGMMTELVKIESYDQWEQLNLCGCVDMAVLHSLFQLIEDQNHEGEVNSSYMQTQIEEAHDQIYFRMVSLRGFLHELEYKFFGKSVPCCESGEAAAASA